MINNFKKIWLKAQELRYNKNLEDLANCRYGVAIIKEYQSKHLSHVRRIIQ